MSSIAELLTRQTASFVADFPGNLYLVDKNLIIYACSDLMARTFGYSSGQDVVGLSVQEFPTCHLAPKVALDCQKVFETGEIVRGERDCLDCHGNDIAYSTQKVPLKDNQGNTYALLAIALDIPAQKKLEKETRLKEKNFKDILSVVPAQVYWKDLKGDYLGSNKQDLDPVGLNDFKMPWAEHAQTYRDQDALVIQTNTTHTFEDSRIDANGTKDFFLSKKQPLKNEEGETIGIIGVTINVTAQKEVERLELEKLEKKLELQDAFRKVVMQANHDIGSPLLVLDLFAHKYLESAPEEQRNSVRNSIQRIRAIAFSMLHRFTENNSEKSDTLLFPLLFEVINEKQLEYPNTPISLATEQESPVCFAFFNADPQAFKRMISNVVNNSIDALTDTPEPFIKIGVSKIQDKIIVTISDNGCGMPESVKNKILASVAVSEGKKSGHGIGYVQIREMLNLHNANLEIESSKEQGTKVTITFPALKNLDYIPQS
ncbi:MAG: PAS domain-containing sensor histidine kinase, partial [Myxococcaceae bacterium]